MLLKDDIWTPPPPPPPSLSLPPSLHRTGSHLRTSNGLVVEELMRSKVTERSSPQDIRFQFPPIRKLLLPKGDMQIF